MDSYLISLIGDQWKRSTRNELHRGIELTKRLFGFAHKIRVETIVPDTKVKEIVDTTKHDGTIRGKMLISDVLDHLDLK